MRKVADGFRCRGCGEVFKKPLDRYKGDPVCIPCKRSIEELAEFLKRVEIAPKVSLMPDEWRRVEKLQKCQNPPNVYAGEMGVTCPNGTTPHPHPIEEGADSPQLIETKGVTA